MKKIAIVLLFAFGCSEKESFTTYRITDVQQPGTFACKYTATASGKPSIIFSDECGKYKVGQIIKVEL